MFLLVFSIYMYMYWFILLLILGSIMSLFYYLSLLFVFFVNIFNMVVYKEIFKSYNVISLVLFVNFLGGFCIMVLTLLMCMLIGMFLSPWYGFILFLIYVGGLLVMFAYVVALIPNIMMYMDLSIILVGIMQISFVYMYMYMLKFLLYWY